jgi:predicted acetyltransferase
MQLYAYDWSELLPLDVGDDGRFEAYALDPYWQDALYHPLLLRVGEKLAGFALVVGKSQLTGRVGVFDMAEFFVLRRYRGKGVGLTAAQMAFDRFDGPWEIRQRTENPGATAFWRRAIAAYTSAPFEELSWNDDKWKGPVQRFSK